MTLAEARANVRRRVVYRPAGAPAEEGLIERVGSVAVFVRYDGHGCPLATNPEDLTLITAEVAAGG